MTKFLLSFAMVLVIPLLACACMWDADTPKAESLDEADILDAITGRFERYPSKYYEMRIARLTPLMQSASGDLAAYDDIAVACERLGRSDEAVEWMRKKRIVLDSAVDDEEKLKEHSYRYHANLGTFIVHRWIKNGSDRSAIHEVQAARDEIAEAIRINPQAHFGREIYQLMALDWIISPPSISTNQAGIPNLLGWRRDGSDTAVDSIKAHEAVRGIVGLIRLGNAWESLDAFNALYVALQYDKEIDPAARESLSAFALLRCEELIDQGKGSMIPAAPRGEPLKLAILDSAAAKLSEHRETFRTLRGEADNWTRAFTWFIERNLATGQHPDTFDAFWSSYEDSESPRRLAYLKTILYRRDKVLASVNALPTRNLRLAQAGFLSFAAATVFLAFRMRRKRSAGARTESPA